MPDPLLEIKDLNIAFETNRGDVHPVRDVSLSIYPGQTVALVGESGCGKSVTAMSVLRLIPSPPGKVPASVPVHGTQEGPVKKQTRTQQLLGAVIGIIAFVAYAAVILGFLGLSIMGMIKGFGGQHWKMPIVGNLAEKNA